MKRRNLLKAAGVLSAAAIVPRGAIAACARVACELPAPPLLGHTQLSLIGAIADTLLPRTATPGALDVGVVGFVDTMVRESFSHDEQERFVSGLAVVGAFLGDGFGRSFVDLDARSRERRIADIEAQSLVYRAVSRLLRHGEPRRTYWELKELIVNGYFTSEVVAKKIDREHIMAGRFDGAAPFSRNGHV